MHLFIYFYFKVRQQQIISTYFTGLLAMIRINVMQIGNTACQTKKYYANNLYLYVGTCSRCCSPGL
jgi:hypothetical protein